MLRFINFLQSLPFPPHASVPLPLDVPSTSLSLKHHNPQLFGSSRLLSQKTYVVARACLAFNSLYWLIQSVLVFGNAHWLVSAFDSAWVPSYRQHNNSSTIQRRSNNNNSSCSRNSCVLHKRQLVVPLSYDDTVVVGHTTVLSVCCLGCDQTWSRDSPVTATM